MVRRTGVSRWTAALAAGCALVAGAPAEAAPLKPQPCEHVAASPAFATDGIAFCAGTTMDGFTPNGLAVFVTTDKGRSWRRATALGLPFKADARISGLLVSPAYAGDRTVVVSVWSVGVFVSADAGETFTPLLPGATPRLTAYAVDLHDPENSRTATVVAAQWLGGKPALLNPLTRSIQPVLGAPDPATEILVSPAWGTDNLAFAVTDTGAVGKNRVSVYGCTATFDCATRLATFAPGYRYQRGWFAADFARSRTLFVQLQAENMSAPRLYVSRDAGRTFRAMTSAQAIVDAHVRRPEAPEPAVGLATGAPGSDRVWLRVRGSSRVSVPTTELFRSDDNGRTWIRVAYGRIEQPGSRGTMPDLRLPGATLQPLTLLAATGDNRLFHTGITTGGWGVACSADGGRTWATFCR